MKKADFVRAIDEAIEASELASEPVKKRIFTVAEIRSREDYALHNEIRPMNEIESLQSRNQALTARVRQLENDLARLQSWAEGLNAEGNELALSIMGALPWMILLGDYIGNGTKDDPMGRCNAILKMNNALGRNDEEAIESGRVDIR